MNTPEKAAAALYPLHAVSPVAALNLTAISINDVVRKERAAYIAGDAAGYARAVEACVGRLTSMAYDLDRTHTLARSTLNDAVEALRTLASGKE